MSGTQAASFETLEKSSWDIGIIIEIFSRQNYKNAPYPSQ